jgi:hypothetical protein
MARVNPVLVVGDDGYAGALAGLVASGTHSAPGLVSPDAPDLQDRLPDRTRSANGRFWPVAPRPAARL